jgi:phosphate transport system substrate-binding protein
VGIAVEGNEGIAGQVRQAEGGIGYLELAYARQNALPVAALRNSAGRFVLPSEAGVRAALASLTSSSLPQEPSRVERADAPDAYPVATLTWLILDPRLLRPDRGRQVVRFVRWALHDGAAQARALEYAPLAPPVVAHYDSMLSGMRFGRCLPDVVPRAQP